MAMIYFPPILTILMAVVLTGSMGVVLYTTVRVWLSYRRLMAVQKRYEQTLKEATAVYEAARRRALEHFGQEPQEQERRLH